MTESSLIYKVALSMLHRMNADFVRHMDDCGVSAEDFFLSSRQNLKNALEIDDSTFYNDAEREEALIKARAEVLNMGRHNVKAHFLLDDTYPIRLSEAHDAPVLIYSLGCDELEGEHNISLVGTRKPTAYGVDFSKKLVEDLASFFPDLTVVSGLAYGIDAAAHTTALECGAKTIAVVAHGLNMIYPASHRDLARSIISKGGSIISEYPFGVKPYRGQFLERNRIVAAMSDVTIVAESDIKGGAMSTANTAFSYGREVMALPGRTCDTQSTGCNNLIRKNKAQLITCAADLIEAMGWTPLGVSGKLPERNLFPELEGDNSEIYETLRFSSDALTIDLLHLKTGIPVSRLMASLGELEFEGIVCRHPGNRYTLS